MTDKQKMLIAVDGPVSAGKSTLCDALSRKLSILHLDTGAMYRAMGLYALRESISPDDENALNEVVKNRQANIQVDYVDGLQVTLLNGEDVTGLLRSEEVGAYASAVSRFPSVRKYLVSLQQEMARERSLLIDGRDIGTVVLPNAKVKIFLTASPEDRALRRYTQLLSAGSKADYAMVLKDLLARDEQDKCRKTDPLRAAPDAIVLDTSKLSFEESLEKMLDIVNAAYGQ